MIHAGLQRKVLTVSGVHGSHQQTFYVKPYDPAQNGQVRLGQNSLRFATKVETCKPAERATVHFGMFWSKRANEGVSHALQAIGKVHAVPKDLYKIPIHVTGSLDGAHAMYTIGRNGQNRIEVSKHALGPAGAVAHEYGHFLDHNLFGTGAPSFAGEATTSRSPELKGLMHALYRSQAGRELTKRHVGHVQSQNFQGQRITNYLLTPAEMLARGYAQWIGLRGSKKIHQEIHEYGRQGRARGYAIQWHDKDFEPIAREFDRLFENRHLRRRSSP